MPTTGLATARAPSLGRIYVTSAICCLFFGLYGLAHQSPAPVVQLFSTFATIVSVVLWLQADARVRGIRTVHDWGLFVYLAWPVIVPWYAVKTRGGPRGWPVAAVIYFAIIVPPLLGAAIKIMEHLR